MRRENSENFYFLPTKTILINIVVISSGWKSDWLEVMNCVRFHLISIDFHSYVFFLVLFCQFSDVLLFDTVALTSQVLSSNCDVDRIDRMVFIFWFTATRKALIILAFKRNGNSIIKRPLTPSLNCHRPIFLFLAVYLIAKNTTKSRFKWFFSYFSFAEFLKWKCF